MRLLSVVSFRYRMVYLSPSSRHPSSSMRLVPYIAFTLSYALMSASDFAMVIDVIYE